MKELEVLLSKRWILKSRDKEMYYKLRYFSFFVLIKKKSKIH